MALSIAVLCASGACFRGEMMLKPRSCAPPRRPLAGEAREDHVRRPSGPSPWPARARWSASGDTTRPISRSWKPAMPISSGHVDAELAAGEDRADREDVAGEEDRVDVGLLPERCGSPCAPVSGTDRRLVVHDMDRRRASRPASCIAAQIALGAMAGALVVLARPVDEGDAAIAGADQLARSSHAPPRGWNSRRPCRPARRRSPRSRPPGCRSRAGGRAPPLVWVRPVSTIASGRRSRIERIWLSSTSVR